MILLVEGEVGHGPLVDDEVGHGPPLEEALRVEGFDVESEPNSRNGCIRALTSEVELVVLELVPAEKRGAEVLGEIARTRPALPVIVLGASREVQDRVSVLDAGAVDYLVRPFSVSELAARIRVQLRSAARSTSTIEAGGVRVDLLTRRVTVAGRTIRMSPTEFELLVALMRSSPQTLAREDILRSVWGYHHDPCTNIVDVYVGYLRRKLGALGSPSPIVTIRGRGYRFETSRPIPAADTQPR